MDYNKTVSLSGSEEKALEVARNVFIQHGFEIVENSNSKLELQGTYQIWLKGQNPLVGVSRVRVQVAGSNLSVEADFGVIRFDFFHSGAGCVYADSFCDSIFTAGSARAENTSAFTGAFCSLAGSNPSDGKIYEIQNHPGTRCACHEHGYGGKAERIIDEKLPQTRRRRWYITTCNAAGSGGSTGSGVSAVVYELRSEKPTVYGQTRAG